MWYPLLVVVALVSTDGSPAAQCCRRARGLDEVAAGAGGNAVLRGPWVTAAWRKPLPRLALFTLGSFTYEKFVDHGGWNASDFNQRLPSYLGHRAGGAARRRAAARALARQPWPRCTAPPPATGPPWECEGQLRR